MHAGRERMITMRSTQSPDQLSVQKHAFAIDTVVCQREWHNRKPGEDKEIVATRFEFRYRVKQQSWTMKRWSVQTGTVSHYHPLMNHVAPHHMKCHRRWTAEFRLPREISTTWHSFHITWCGEGTDFDSYDDLRVNHPALYKTKITPAPSLPVITLKQYISVLLRTPNHHRDIDVQESKRCRSGTCWQPDSRRRHDAMTDIAAAFQHRTEMTMNDTDVKNWCWTVLNLYIRYKEVNQ